ncbi:MAG: riboflavin synthase, partial [Pseudomonadota bacterium]
MFTGLVEEMGTVLTVGPEGEGFALSIEGSVTLEGLKFGDSINVNGVCLSVTSFNEREMQFGLAPETLRRTSLSLLQPGSPVNLERAVLPTTRLGGHYVQGHVDGTGTIKDITEEGDALMVTIAAPLDILKYVVPKGYISV